jgi:hypothetical protein
MPLAPFCFSSKRAFFFSGVRVSFAADPVGRRTGYCIDSALRFPMMRHGLRQQVEGADFSAWSMSAGLFANGVPFGRTAWLAVRCGIGDGFLVRRSPVREAV